MPSRYLTIVVLMMVALLPWRGGAQLEPLQLKIQATTGNRVTLKLIDIDARNRSLPKGGEITVTATGGQVQIRNTWAEQAAFPVAPGAMLPSFTIQSGGLMPDSVTITATLRAPDYGTFSATENIPAAPWWSLLIAGLVGGVLGSLKEVFQNLRRTNSQSRRRFGNQLPPNQVVTAKQVAGALGTGVVIGLLVFGLGTVTPLWKAIGVENAAAYPQTYLGLSVAIALIGVERVVDKAFGRDKTEEDAPLADRMNEVVQEWTAGLGTRLRTELQDFFYRGDYLRDSPQFMERLEKEIVRARYPAIDEELHTYWRQREDLVFLSSHRENLTISIRCVPKADHLLWTQEDAYSYIRNPADLSTIPEIRPYVEEDIDDSSLAAGRIDVFGSIVEEMHFEIGTDSLGFVEYTSVPGQAHLVISSGTPPFSAPDRVDVAFNIVEPEEEGQLRTLRFGYEFRLPSALRDQETVKFKGTGRWRKIRRDDMYFIRMERVTHRMTVSCNMTPPLHVDTVRFEWRPVRAKSPSSGAITNFDDWLLPGHGLCVAWYGIGGPPRLNKDRTSP
jgi:hypothetical protein